MDVVSLSTCGECGAPGYPYGYCDACKVIVQARMDEAVRGVIAREEVAKLAALGIGVDETREKR